MVSTKPTFCSGKLFYFFTDKFKRKRTKRLKKAKRIIILQAKRFVHQQVLFTQLRLFNGDKGSSSYGGPGLGLTTSLLKDQGPFLKCSETSWEYLGHHISLVFKPRPFKDMKLRHYDVFLGLVDMLKDQHFKIGGSFIKN